MLKETLLGKNFHAPLVSSEPNVPTFNEYRLGQVINLIQNPSIGQAMQAEGLAQDPRIIIAGEIGRLMMLSGAFHPDFYHKSIGLLMASGAIKPGYSMIELGTSMAGHLPQMPNNLQPDSLIGLDNQPYIVAAAKKALALYGEAGLLDPSRYEIILGDHTYQSGLKKDVSILSLASQYDGGVSGTVEWLMNHCKVAGVNGDVVHTPWPVSDKEFNSGILPFRTKRLPSFGGYTGVNLKLEGDPVETVFGDVYRTSLLLDDEIYNYRNGIVQIPQPGTELEGKATVFEKDGKMFVEPWAWELTDHATDEDKKYLPAVRRTFNEQYSQLEHATNHSRVWESITALGVPVYAAQEFDAYSGVIFNTATSVAQRSGMLPMAMLRRNGEEVRQIYEKGLFSEIGEGKTFSDLGDLYRVIGGYLSDPRRFSEIVKYTNPLLVTSITTKHQDVFDNLRSAAPGIF